MAPNTLNKPLLPRWFLGTVRQWHWISSAVCLVGLLLFAVTGITLNHASLIPATPEVTTIEDALPQALLQQIASDPGEAAPLPQELRQWFLQNHGVALPAGRTAEWTEYEVYLSLPRPGGDAWLSLDRETGDLVYERTERGWVSYLNDLHKGRETGAVWRGFIDVFSLACVVFSLSGLVLLKRQAAAKASTWPLVGLGLIIPLLLVILFVHP